MDRPGRASATLQRQRPLLRSTTAARSTAARSTAARSTATSSLNHERQTPGCPGSSPRFSSSVSRQGPGKDGDRAAVPVHRHSFQVHPSQVHPGCEADTEWSSLQERGSHSYSEGRQRGVLGAHCSLGTADHQGNFGQGSTQLRFTTLRDARMEEIWELLPAPLLRGTLGQSITLHLLHQCESLSDGL